MVVSLYRCTPPHCFRSDRTDSARRAIPPDNRPVTGTRSGTGDGTMVSTLYLATNSGLVIAEHNGADWGVAGRTLEGHHVTSVIAREGVILAGTRHGVVRSDDGGQSWGDASAGLTERHVRWLAYHPDRSDLEFAGTEPAAIFVSHDGAQTWRPCPEVAQLRDHFRWSLPYSPEAGCVRGFAVHGERVYAAVE